MTTPKAIVIMGVSGCGKSSVGRNLAAKLGYHFVEGDDLHSPESVAKMAAGQPLNDEDRWPWLARVVETLNQHEAGCVVSCSALRRSYRQKIIAGCNQDMRFVFLDVDRDRLMTRLSNRAGHYMPASLLDSQLATLERPQPDEPVITVTGTEDRAGQLNAILAKLASLA